MTIKHDESVVKSKLLDSGFVLLKPYQNAISLMSLQCVKCEYKFERKWWHFNGGNIGCPGCLRKAKLDALHENIRQICAKRNYTVTTPWPEIATAKTKFAMQCQYGHTFEKHWNRLQQGEICAMCQRERLDKSGTPKRNRGGYSKEYYHASKEDRRDSINQDKRKWANKKRSVCPKFRLAHNVRRRITAQLKTKHDSRPLRTILGYPSADLRQHLEQLFSDDMTWDNYGTYWQVDHVIPIVYYNIQSLDDPKLREAWALSNLRPLPALANSKKSDFLPDGTRARDIIKQASLGFLGDQ